MRVVVGVIVVVFQLVACGDGEEPGGVDAGGADAGGGADASSVCAEREGFEIGFSMTGLAEGESEVALTCAAELARDDDGMVVAFTACVDGVGQTHGDLELRLLGDWPEPPIQEAETRLHYVEQLFVFGVERWLVLETDGQFPLPLAIIHAGALVPEDEADFSYGPISLSARSGGCEPVPDSCGPLDRLVVEADYGGDRRSILDGTRIDDLGSASGGASVQFEVLVPQATDRGEVSCTDLMDPVLMVGIVAFPFS